MVKKARVLIVEDEVLVAEDPGGRRPENGGY
jgi:hypothetical protein